MEAAVQSGGDDWFPTPTAGDTQLFFYVYPGASAADLVVATRATPTSPFGAPQLVTELDTTNDEQAPTLTDDGLEIVWVYRTQTVASDLMTSRRASTTATWPAGTPIATINGANADSTPWISGDGLRLWLTSDRPGTLGGLDLYEATRTDRAAAWGAPSHIIEVSSGQNDASPTLSADGLDVFFTSGPSGNYDVYTAHRPALDQPFGPPQRVAELSSARDEYGLRLSRDGATMYLNYDTLVAGGGQADLWIATRACQ